MKIKSGISTALVITSLGILASQTAFAQGDAGCGLGGLIIQKNAKVSQILAVTSNLSFLSQPFGITSGTSGCSASGLTKADEEAAVYAEANYQSLKIEMARGTGENLAAFSQLLGCKESSRTEFARMARDKFDAIYSTESVSPIDMVKSVRMEISKDSNLSQSCARVS